MRVIFVPAVMGLSPSPLAGEGAPTGRVAPEGTLRADEGWGAEPCLVQTRSPGFLLNAENHPLPPGERGSLRVCGAAA